MLQPESLVNRLISAKIADPKQIVGCTDDDIVQLEADAGCCLPRAYLAFLRIAGRGAGKFMSDLTIYFPQTLGLTKRIRSTFGEILELPSDAFVFMDRMGETYCFFQLSLGGDPPVLCWDEGTESVRQVYNSVWEFIERELLSAEMIA